MNPRTQFFHRYAVFGAAAFTSAFTQTVSAAIVVMGVTNTYDYIVPGLYTTIVALFLHRAFSTGVYDLLIYVRVSIGVERK